MIKYNSNTINDWYYDSNDIIKVYYHNAVCYYKLTPSGGQVPCFAVVDNISQYSDTEFIDVFNKDDGKWYKLNNLNQYEKYGVYGSSTATTYYEGKLTIDSNYEYIYSGNSWNNVGAVSGSSRLPDGYTEVEYIENTSMACINTNFIPNQDSRMLMRMQCITNNSGGRYMHAGGSWSSTDTISFDYENSTLHVKWAKVGGWSTYNSVVRDYDPHIYDFNKNEFYVDETLVGSTTYTSFTCSNTLAIFTLKAGNDISTQSGEYLLGRMYYFKIYDNGTLARDFVPCKRNSDSAVGAYDLVNNEFYGSARSGYVFTAGTESGGVVYPMYYTQKDDPQDNVSFSSMTEAQSYECPWWGMTGIIDNTDYLFCDSNEWLTKYSYQEVSGDYLCDSGNKYKKMQEYDRNIDGTFSATTHYVKGDLIESGSTDCYRFDGKWIAYIGDSVAYSAACDSSSAITRNEVRQGNYTAYTKVIIGDCVTNISEAFQKCSSMTEVEIGSAVTSSLYYCFEDCTALSSVTWYATAFPQWGNQDGGFQRCYALEKLVMYATTPPSVSYTMFNGVPATMTVYVPDEAISAYQSANIWQNFTIKGHSEL